MSKNPRLMAVCGLVCLSCAAATGYVALRGFTTPVHRGLVTETAVIDLGAVFQGDRKECRFKLANDHSEPLEIVELLAGCSCNTPTSSANVVPPGGLFEVSSEWSIGDRRGDLADTITVLYRRGSSAPSQAVLTMKAHVLADIEYAPTELTFSADSPGVVQVKFSPGRVRNFRVQYAAVGQEAFAVAVNDRADAVDVRFDPGAWVDIGSQPTLFVRTDNSERPTVTIPIRVQNSVTKSKSGV